MCSDQNEKELRLDCPNEDQRERWASEAQTSVYSPNMIL